LIEDRGRSFERVQSVDFSVKICNAALDAELLTLPCLKKPFNRRARVLDSAPVPTAFLHTVDDGLDGMGKDGNKQGIWILELEKQVF